MLLITAPSKTQQPIDRQFTQFTRPSYLKQSEKLIHILKRYGLEELGTLMKMSETLAEKTREKILAFQPPCTLGNCKQAIFTFQGDAYSSLTPESYSEPQLAHAQAHIRILSGLYGILRPLDLMFPYRLEMGCKFATAEWKNLYDFWGNTLTDAINEECEQYKYATVINLASVEYTKVIHKKHLVPQLLTITFQERKGDDYKTVPIHSKRARGMMLHYVIENQLNSAEQLLLFNMAGYSFSKERSNTTNWIFTRD